MNISYTSKVQGQLDSEVTRTNFDAIGLIDSVKAEVCGAWSGQDV